MRNKSLMVRLTAQQMQILDARANLAGFSRRSDYVRAVLFMPLPMEEKIKEMYEILKKWQQSGN